MSEIQFLHWPQHLANTISVYAVFDTNWKIAYFHCRQVHGASVWFWRFFVSNRPFPNESTRIWKVHFIQQSFYNWHCDSLFLEYPDFNIPKLDPFKMKKPSVLRTRNPSSPISLVIHNSNVTIYGLNNIEIKQIKYVYSLHLISLISKIYTTEIPLFIFAFQGFRTGSKTYEIGN